MFGMIMYILLYVLLQRIYFTHIYIYITIILGILIIIYIYI